MAINKPKLGVPAIAAIGNPEFPIAPIPVLQQSCQDVTSSPPATAMSCYDLCRPCGPTPLANSCNEPCVRQCQDSRVIIEPSPVVVTLPGPILSSFPQNTAVGSSTSAAVGSILSESGVPINSGGFGLSGLSGLGGRYCGRRCLPC
ncbi:Feather beta keratin [Lonchura striata]|uniref:Keratin n=1 Tax=Lonchura striata TaxID=40157 RepID=A0A218UER5_9PASE|nr:Feather beta keratin [Lonchura striata domestica]